MIRVAAPDEMSVVHRAESFRTAILSDKYGRILAAFEKVVEDSFVTHPMRNRTVGENRRRANLVIEAFRTMQGEHHWSTDQCLAHLPAALTAALDGRRWTLPKKRTLWGADAVKLADFGPPRH